MIHGGQHHVTKDTRVLAECDTPDCDWAEYMPEEIGVQTAGLRLRRLGWDIGVRNEVMGIIAGLPARCPDHATLTTTCTHTQTVFIERVRVCSWCGRRIDGIKEDAA